MWAIISLYRNASDVYVYFPAPLPSTCHSRPAPPEFCAIDESSARNRFCNDIRQCESMWLECTPWSTCNLTAYRNSEATELPRRVQTFSLFISEGLACVLNARLVKTYQNTLYVLVRFLKSSGLTHFPPRPSIFYPSSLLVSLWTPKPMRRTATIRHLLSFVESL